MNYASAQSGEVRGIPPPFFLFVPVPLQHGYLAPTVFKCLPTFYKTHTRGVPKGGWGFNPPPRNSEVLTKSNRIANGAENV